MKNFIRLVVVAIVAIATMGSGFAQEQAQEQAIPKSTKVKAKKMPGIDYRHEFRLGVGSGTVPIYNFPNGFGSVFSNYPCAIYSAYYGYRIVKGLKVTATFGFGSYSYKTPASEAGVVNTSSLYNYRISPSVQYEWYNRGLVTFYSEIGCTFAFDYINTTNNGVNSQGPIDTSYGLVRFDVTPIGITVGKKLFGFAELLSFGPRGFINAGIGYRFK